MARVNVGLNPKYLTDQHLVAESVEITMITGSLRRYNYKIKGNIPDSFKLGQGHINFFKNKVVYLVKRLQEVNSEMLKRGFKPGTSIRLEEFPEQLCNDWSPTLKDTVELRQRVVERLYNPKSGKDGSLQHKYYRKPLSENINLFCNQIMEAELNIV
jgi:deoxyribonuclease (pyrimidine dimer)